MSWRSNGRWSVAGINGEDKELDLQLDLGELATTSDMLLADGDDAGFNRRQVKLASDGMYSVRASTVVGFVSVLD